MKPRIFIGSSSEGKPTAAIINNLLSSVADCFIWDEPGFFENNKSSFESLSENSTLFDFAILIATDDDIQLKRNTVEVIARDNVIFEFGLYIGRLGRNRCFLVKDKEVDLPSDLFGITLQVYKTKPTDRGKTLEEVCNGIKEIILEQWNLFELRFVPSTGLALGYFQNFLAPISRELMQSAKRKVGDREFKNFKLHVMLPDELPDNFHDQVVAYLAGKKLEQMVVETVTRKYNFYLDYGQSENEILELYDLPTILSALKKTIELAVPSSHIGESKKERILKQKEMNNFKRTLDYLVNENAITKSHVVIEYIDVN